MEKGAKGPGDRSIFLEEMREEVEMTEFGAGSLEQWNQNGGMDGIK